MTLTFIIQRMWVVHNMVDLGSYNHIVCNKEKTLKCFKITSEKTSPHVFYNIHLFYFRYVSFSLSLDIF